MLTSRIFERIRERTAHLYAVKNPPKALIRDLNCLVGLQALAVRRSDKPPRSVLSVNLAWPTEITETEFFRRVKEMPKGKVHGFLSS